MRVPMLLPDFVLPELENIVLGSTGLDSVEFCKDRQHFKKFNLPISYAYNSRGFRDSEWPLDPQQSIWCMGDSFTVGLGLPFALTWPQQIRTNLDGGTVSVAMDGASNQWIARRACQVLEQICPKHMIIMWSYFHRRELLDPTLTDMARRLHYGDLDQLTIDYDNFETCIKSVVDANKTTTIIHAMIPDCHDVVHAKSIWDQIKGESWPEQLPASLTNLPEFIQHEIVHVHDMYDKLEKLCQCNTRLESLKTTTQFVDYDVVDLARDGHHFGPKTSELLGKKLCGIIGTSVP
jgi:hypothetical protein